MKITTFNPLIMSPASSELIEVFEALGFERKHEKKELNGEGITDVRLRSEGGFHVDVASVNRLPQDMNSIRMNVDDFDEAYKLLTDLGFRNSQGDKISESPSGKGTAMISPTGFIITLSHHKKEHK